PGGPGGEVVEAAARRRGPPPHARSAGTPGGDLREEPPLVHRPEGRRREAPDRPRGADRQEGLRAEEGLVGGRCARAGEDAPEEGARDDDRGDARDPDRRAVAGLPRPRGGVPPAAGGAARARGASRGEGTGREGAGGVGDAGSSVDGYFTTPAPTRS